MFTFSNKKTSTHTATLTPSPTGAATETTLPSPTATHTVTLTATLSEVTATATHTATLTETATATTTATATLTPTMSASLTPEELPLLDTVAVEFESATYTYDGDGEAMRSIAFAEFELSSNSRRNAIMMENSRFEFSHLNCVSSSFVNGVVTYYVGGHYQLEVDGTTQTETKYYTGSTGRFAMRTDDGTNTALFWIFSDHLQSSSVILDEDEALLRNRTKVDFGFAEFELCSNSRRWAQQFNPLEHHPWTTFR